MFRKVTLLRPSMPTAISVSKTSKDSVITSVKPDGFCARVSRPRESGWRVFMWVLGNVACFRNNNARQKARREHGEAFR